MSEEPEPYLLDRKRAAAFLGVSGSTIRRWFESGQMPEPKIRLHRKKYWTRESLQPLREKVDQSRAE
jgi:predicted site-specific integrase-resolvase